MFDCCLLCRPLPFRQLTCLPGAPRRGPQNRPFWSPGKHVRLFPALSPVALSTANLPARRPKKRSSESSVLAPRAPPNPKRHPKTPWGEPKNSQTAPGGLQGAPLEPRRTTRDHRGTARELPRNPPGPQGPQESPCFFPRTSSLPLPCSCLPSSSSSLLPPFSRPSANFGQPLLANQSVHHPWGSLQVAAVHKAEKTHDVQKYIVREEVKNPPKRNKDE